MQKAEIFLYKRFKIALLFLVVSATYGLLMRLQHIVNIPKFVYTSFLQAHSHVTFLGWGFLAITSLVIFAFVPQLFTAKVVKNSFWIMVAVLIGMLISFPLQGYKVFSIAFLSVFLLTSYIYLGVLFKSLKHKKGISALFIRYGIVYYYLSSLAIWAIPVIKIKVGKGDLYHYGVAFYTHFLYNGFFVFVLFGLFFKYLISNKIISEENKALRFFFQLTNLAVIPTFLLVFLKEKELSGVIIGLAALGGIVQVLSLFYLSKILQTAQVFFSNQKELIKLMFYLVFVAYFAKIGLQFFSAFPSITQRAILFTPYLVIGYIHLFTLGFMTLLLLLLFRLFSKQTLNKLGVILFISGVVLSETMLFLQGGMFYFDLGVISNFNLVLFLVSALMPLGLFTVFVQLRNKG